MISTTLIETSNPTRTHATWEILLYYSFINMYTLYMYNVQCTHSECIARQYYNNNIIIPSQGWLQDMINLFGNLGGFALLQERIVEGENLTVPLIAALIRSID